MTDIQVKVEPPRVTFGKIARRIVIIIAVAAFVGFMMRQLTALLERDPRPPGFLRGMAQGALMPCALPNLIVGKDVTIYAEINTGVPYKLGYTCGVNACGAVFFGIFFWRLNRWRKRVGGPPETPASTPAQS